MSRIFAGIAASVAFVAIAACGGGPGSTTFGEPGPDQGVPGSSTDSPNDGREPPGTSGNDPAGNCMECGATYACVAPEVEGDQVSYVTLSSTSGGCATVDSEGRPTAVLACGGQFYQVDNGQITLVGTWTGGTDAFTVTGKVEGQTIVIECTLTNNPQPQPDPQGGGGSTDTVDGGR